ncbi:hypothetical protein [Sporosarcina psychrophila]|uniref:Uncharacterized protein n=1 Tax=Sporosarcina psychrophila TaxID=1476 RepID=A0ABV2KBP8_SPOPS
MKSYIGEQNAKLVTFGDKYAMVFDDVPSLIFVSYDGNGRMDQTFYKGEQLTNVKAIEIRSGLEEVTEYMTTNYAIDIDVK